MLTSQVKSYQIKGIFRQVTRIVAGGYKLTVSNTDILDNISRVYVLLHTDIIHLEQIILIRILYHKTRRLHRCTCRCFLGSSNKSYYIL